MGTACCPHRVYAVPLVSVGMGVLLAIGEDAGMGRQQCIYGMYLFHVLCHAILHASCLILHGLQLGLANTFRLSCGCESYPSFLRFVAGVGDVLRRCVACCLRHAVVRLLVVVCLPLQRFSVLKQFSVVF